MSSRPCVAITPGEPAGIGPELVAGLGETFPEARLVAIADPALMENAGATVTPFEPSADPAPGHLEIMPVPLGAPVTPGVLDPANAAYVLETLRIAVDGCLDNRFQAMVTGPVHKGIINEAGQPFSGHTEFLAERTGAAMPVMMLAADTLRVALATTHLPLRAVPDAITDERLCRILRILHNDLARFYGLSRPHILVTGLNPHAGESGHLGHEEIEVITPALERLRGEGLHLSGPLPADTLFTPRHLADAAAVLAMYHDQGLPVLKHVGFGHAVNITLGLPIIRTSVDHGTALDLAGQGVAEPGSLQAAIREAIRMSRAGG
ncbi:4-hydroxythreonine-4-phosphate dehydrogenase PdxA [Spiribacter insolitus]|uniref:4-hydroxythreonine-4-phosphate dehydrogenase n=1 Tax=Spiribacter insolitus TaxID=3122417 RepID=A0ABV3T3V2_9GAMM